MVSKIKMMVQLGGARGGGMGRLLKGLGGVKKDEPGKEPGALDHTSSVSSIATTATIKEGEKEEEEPSESSSSEEEPEPGAAEKKNEEEGGGGGPPVLPVVE